MRSKPDVIVCAYCGTEATSHTHVDVYYCSKDCKERHLSYSTKNPTRKANRERR